MLAVKLLMALALVASAGKATVLIHPNDIMDSPQPKAPLARWSDAPGRIRVTLAVGGTLLPAAIPMRERSCMDRCCSCSAVAVI